MALEKLVIKNNRHLAFDKDEVIALDFNESMREIKIYLRGGNSLTVEGKKAEKLWKQLSQNLPELLSQEDGEFISDDFS
ncbi:MAG: hypothetical protein AAB336_04550 [Acidobacteriota bacterium]